METEEETVHVEEEEVTTIHRKSIRKQKTTRHKKKQTNSSKGRTKTEIKLNPFIVGAKIPETQPTYNPPSANQNHVIKLVKETLNEFRGENSSIKIKNTNRVFLGAFDSDDEAEDDFEECYGQRGKYGRSGVKSERRGLERFRKLVEFVILTQHIFPSKRKVRLSRQDSILFFMDLNNNQDNRTDHDTDKFDMKVFKSIGQKGKMISVKNSLKLSPLERTDAYINQMIHSMRCFKKFSNYPLAVQTGLCKNGWYARFESSKVIVKEGNRAEFFYFILSGLAVYRDVETVYDETNTGHAKSITSYLNPGDTIGEKEILTGTDRPATVVCKEPVEVLGVDRDTLLQIFQAARGVGSIEFLKTIPEMTDFPLELLPTHHFSMAIHYYKRGSVIVKSSNESEWIYIVRSGSCQIYMSMREEGGPESNRSMSKSRHNSDALFFPNIHKSKYAVKNTVEDTNVNSVKGKQQRLPVLERSNTCTALPLLKPGKTSMVQAHNSPQEKRCQTSHRNVPREHFSKNIHKQNDVKRNHRHSDTPDVTSYSRATPAICITPDSVNSLRILSLQSPASESKVKLKKKKKECTSSIAESVKTNRSGRYSLKSDNGEELGETTRSGNGGDKIHYVKLGMLTEKGVFGLHRHVHEGTPDLSLVSNGAECVLVSKRFLKEHLTSTVVHRLQLKLQPYPHPNKLRHALDEQLNWETYREKVVNDLLK